LVNLAQAGIITMLGEHFPLARASEAYRLLHDGKIQDARSLHPTTDQYPYLPENSNRPARCVARVRRGELS
jgi:hypothetical protein